MDLPFNKIIVVSRHADSGNSNSFEISLPETLSPLHNAVCYVCDLQVTKTFSSADPTKTLFTGSKMSWVKMFWTVSVCPIRHILQTHWQLNYKIRWTQRLSCSQVLGMLWHSKRTSDLSKYLDRHFLVKHSFWSTTIYCSNCLIPSWYSKRTIILMAFTVWPWIIKIRNLPCRC